MPKKPIDYANSSIYKLCCRDTDITDCYIGSTTNFRTRKCQHKTVCYNENSKAYNRKVYQFIRDNGGWENWDMVLIEKVNVNDNYELKKEERRWIEQMNSTLNICIPTRTEKEWGKDNIDRILEYKKDYYKNNKEYFKEYYEVNKEKISEHYEVNKEKLNEKIECPFCKSIVCKRSLPRHQKSMKCLESKTKM